MSIALENPRIRPQARSESGFALILAILALMLLTFLGMTLAATTSTEVQIAANHRWAVAARYNAEAGIEAGKSILRTMDWDTILPAVRTVPDWTPTAVGLGVKPTTAYARPDLLGFPTRNFENGAVTSGSTCDKDGNGAGYGAVLDDGGAAQYQNAGTLLGQTLNGSVTLWVRRALMWAEDGTVKDDPSNDTLILTAEGSAPALNGVNRLSAGRAISVLELTVSRSLSDVCANRTGQAGGGPEGAGFSACDKIKAEGLAGVLGVAVKDLGIK